jgi:hypothetical protein
MKTLKAKVLSILKLQPYRMRDKSDDENKDTAIKFWRMRVSYLGPETLYEVELREPLKSFASKKYAVGLNGLVEFEMFSHPEVAAGDSIQVDGYEPGEKILGERTVIGSKSKRSKTRGRSQAVRQSLSSMAKSHHQLSARTLRISVPRRPITNSILRRILLYRSHS